MQLAEIIGLRPVACAGLLVTLTRRCPMSCAHCSTASTMADGHVSRAALLRFFGTFRPAGRPEVVIMTGGEPMLRPRLVAQLAEQARGSGARSVVLTGAFFARGGRIPDPVRRAVDAVDHCSVSLDAYHERQVPRADVFALLHRLLGRGVAVSLHVTGTGRDDPYLADVTSQVSRRFGAQVPMLVSELRAIGRAASWRTAIEQAAAATVEPCTLAAWPVVAVDGTITACCSQDVVDGPERPGHLRLGHIASESWAEIRRRSAGSAALRLLRTAGPRYLCDDPLDVGALTPARYCATCHALDRGSVTVQRRLAVAAGPVGQLLDEDAARHQVGRGAAGFVRRYGVARYADLVAPA